MYNVKILQISRKITLATAPCGDANNDYYGKKW